MKQEQLEYLVHWIWTQWVSPFNLLNAHSTISLNPLQKLFIFSLLQFRSSVYSFSSQGNNTLARPPRIAAYSFQSKSVGAGQNVYAQRLWEHLCRQTSWTLFYLLFGNSISDKTHGSNNITVTMEEFIFQITWSKARHSNWKSNNKLCL